MFRDEVPQPVGVPAGPQGPGGPGGGPSPHQAYEAAARPSVEAEPDQARDWRDDYEEAVSATRWDLTPIPSMPVAPRRANPSNLEALIPPRRGRVQGPATRHPGGPAGTGPATGTREPEFAPWDRDRSQTAPPTTKPETAKTNVGRASRLMALGTMASRATGLIRQFMIVATLTTGTLGDAYNAGNNLPNIIYILVLGGALNAVFVPQLVRAMNRDRDGGAAFASRLVTLTVVTLLVLTIAAVVAAPQLVDLFTSFTHPEDRAVAIIFAELCLPQIFFYGVFVILGQILNAQGRFGPMMWTPVLANVVTIAVFGAYWWIVKDPLSTATIRSWQPILRLVGIGTTLGIAVQTLALVPYIRASGLRLSPRFDWRGTGLGKSFTLAKWTVAFVLVNQVGLLVVMRYATAVGDDYQGWGLTAYNSAFMIWGLPQAIITVSVITALLPRMSRSAADKDLSSVREDISYGLRVTGVAIVPAAFAFLALGQQIAMVLFMYGSVTADSAHIIGFMLTAFGLGLIPFSAQFLMLRGFYAFEDTRTPFTINIWIAAANVAMSSGVYYGVKHTKYERWAVVIMCAVYGVAYCIGLVITAAKLKRRLHGLEGGRIMQTYVRLTASAAVAAASAYVIAAYVTHVFGGGSRIGAYVGLLLGGGILGVMFLLCARLMKVEEVEQLLGSLRRKLGR